jgi:hypothetical protein
MANRIKKWLVRNQGSVNYLDGQLIKQLGFQYFLKSAS